MEGAPKQADRVNIVAIVIIGMIGALVVYASFTALQAYYNASVGKLQAQRDIEGKSHALHELQARQQGELSEYRMLEKRKQIVALPIERAMKLVIDDVRNGNSKNLVPAVGPHDTPTAPVVNTQPEDTPPLIAPPAPTPAPTPVPAGSEGSEATGAPPAEGAAPAENPAGAPAGGQ